MKSNLDPESSDDGVDDALKQVMREIVRAVRSVRYGSVEVVIQNSRVVQIERKEKFRFDKGLSKVCVNDQ
jgi:hypothetical protein